MNDSNAALTELIDEPRESLDVEVKDWLDLSSNDHRATLAKEIIALANHGGGYLIVGFTELDDGGFEASPTRPSNLEDWSQDKVQSIVSKYIDPTIQCRVKHVTASGGSDRFPVIVVPGGQRVPVRAKAGSPDGKLTPHRIYVRRAGPASEEPQTAEEWDRLLGRIVQNRQDELLEAMRSIMSGVLPSSGTTEPSLLDRLASFEDLADRRWQQLVSGLDPDVPPRFPHGFYDISFAIDGDFDQVTLGALREIVEREVRNHSGWPPFLTIHRNPYAPRPVDGTIETWIGPDNDGSYDKPAHHDFWRVSPDGFLFIRRGYQEDGGYKQVAPGTTLDITTPTWRLGEAILEASYIARALGAQESDLVIRAKWTRLAGRELVSLGNSRRFVFEGKKAQQSEYESTQTVAVNALPGALPEVVAAILFPLYELFDFFKLPKSLIDQELAEMQKTRF